MKAFLITVPSDDTPSGKALDDIPIGTAFTGEIEGVTSCFLKAGENVYDLKSDLSCEVDNYDAVVTNYKPVTLAISVK
jgi:hypothetical protein